MKSTNPILSSFWVKVIPVLVLVFCLGWTNSHAQNYKPLNEAVQSVETALDALKEGKSVGPTLTTTTSNPSKLNSGMPQSQVKVFEIGYFQRFLEQTKLTGGVAEAVQALDAEFNSQGQQASRNSTVSTARGELMSLITY